MNLSKGLWAVLFVALTAFTASAYTVVMRDGRRVEIPNEFTVTNSTLTYPAGQGIQITIQLNTVDIAATERANGQAAGALLRNASAPKEVPKRDCSNANARAHGQLPTATSKLIESPVKRKTRSTKSDARSWACLQWKNDGREAAEIQERTREQLLSMRAQEEMTRDTGAVVPLPLRTELAATHAQIEFLRRRINELSFSNSFGVFSTGIPFGTVGASVHSTFRFKAESRQTSSDRHW